MPARAVVLSIIALMTAWAGPVAAITLGYQQAGTAGTGPMQLAIARPSGDTRRTAVLILHGTHGFAAEYVALAKDIAAAGYVAIAACWFQGGQGSGRKAITPVRCPDGTPPLVEADSPEAQQRLDALVSAVRRLPGVDPERIALFGHSRGAGAVRRYLLRGGRAQAAILNSAGYPPVLAADLDKLSAPILILHGLKDGPADGGSEMTAIDRARSFEAILRQSGKDVEATYYIEGRHGGLFTNPVQRAAQILRIRDYLATRFQRP